MSKGAVTTFGYDIQARSPHGPVQLGNHLIGEKWRRIPTYEGPGVPNPVYDALAQSKGLMAYSTAVSLMAGCAASAEAALRLSVEFRLVKKRIEYSYEITVEGYGPATNFFMKESRESTWEKPEKPDASEDTEGS